MRNRIWARGVLMTLEILREEESTISIPILTFQVNGVRAKILGPEELLAGICILE